MLTAGVVLSAGVIQGCSLSPNEAGDGGVGGDVLGWQPAVETVVCDDTEQVVGSIDGAEPGERLEFISRQPVEVPAVTADDDGLAELAWSCGPEEARLRWSLTATGEESGRSVEVAIVGAHQPEEAAEFTVTIGEEGDRGPVVCDGQRHLVGALSNAEPGESIRFSSPQTANLQSGRADGLGESPVFWTCRPADVGEVWEVTATGLDSGQTGRFVLTGVAPEPGDVPPVEVTIVEDPVVCDGQSAVFAQLANLVPGERVSFSSAEAGDLRDGFADGVGSLDLKWQCGQDDVGRTWTLVATGQESGQQASVTFSGVADPAGYPEPSPANVTITEQPFVCDGQRRPVAVITGLRGGEFVDFASEQAGTLREGRADADGQLTVNWQCTSAELAALAPGASWTVTATGRESGQIVTFEITAAQP